MLNFAYHKSFNANEIEVHDINSIRLFSYLLLMKFLIFLKFFTKVFFYLSSFETIKLLSKLQGK